MKSRNPKLWLCCALVVLALSAPAGAAAAYDVYKTLPDGSNIPDVNKNPLTPPPDETCWQAVASNLLAAGGWGKTGNTAQQNADAIYGQLNAHFGTSRPGYEARAINWWLLNYGYNPNAPDTDYYNPTNTYNDVTHVNRSLYAPDYDFLLDELVSCQYAAVSFYNPANPSVGHVMTLVGGNYSTSAPRPPRPPLGAQVAVWHDSDRNVVAPGDDQYPVHTLFF